MSEHFVALIPTDPKAALPANANELRDQLARLLGTDEVRVKDYGKLQFIDCGQNFHTVACPACKAKIGLEQWHAWMDEDWHGEEGFHLHRHGTPCCEAEITLNDLVYDAAQGFSRWMISARAVGLAPDHVTALSKAAGLPLSAILQRY